MSQSLWITLVPILVINAILFALLFIFTFTRKRPEVPEEIKTRHTSRFLNSFFKEWWYWVNDPIAKFFVKIRLNPNSLTVIGTLLGVASAFFFAEGLFGYAGWIMILGATFDMFDGRVARITGQVSRSGAYFDSVMDRVAEGAVFLGLAYYFRESWMLVVVLVGLIGSMLVSYTRARGEGVGVVCKKGAMQRPERTVYIGVASVFHPMTEALLDHVWASPLPILITGALVIIAVMTSITAAQRVLYIMNELDTIDRDEEDLSVPQLLTSFATKEGRGKWLAHARYGYDRSQALKGLCLLILADGLNITVFSELVNKGDLPNITKYIIEPGVFKKATSTFPSTTGPSFTPFITGCFAGTCDIPGIRWFDRRIPPDKKLTLRRFRDYFGWGSYALDFDLSSDVKTIFEYSRRAINILGMVNRGSGVSRDPAFFKAPLLFYQAKKDNREAVLRTAYRMFVQSLRRAPDFIFYYFPMRNATYAVADSRHRVGGLEAYRNLDHYVGKMVKDLKDQGLFEATTLILTSDHGPSDVHTHFDLGLFLEDRLKTFDVSGRFREWLSAEAINMTSGNAMSNLYLRKNGWEEPNYFEEIGKRNLVDRLLEQEAVDCVLGRSREGGVVVASRRGRARLEESNGHIHYQLMGSDPLGYKQMPSILTAEEALELTWASDYPDGIVQALQLFRSPRAGDLVLSAAPGHNLKKQFEDLSHSSGSLHHEHMFVPLCINEKISHDYVRTADLFPMVCKLLGIIPDHEVDGRSII